MDYVERRKKKREKESRKHAERREKKREKESRKHVERGDKVVIERERW